MLRSRIAHHRTFSPATSRFHFLRHTVGGRSAARLNPSSSSSTLHTNAAAVAAVLPNGNSRVAHTTPYFLSAAAMQTPSLQQRAKEGGPLVQTCAHLLQKILDSTGRGTSSRVGLTEDELFRRLHAAFDVRKHLVGSAFSTAASSPCEGELTPAIRLAALELASVSYFVENNLYYPFDWEDFLRDVAAKLPYEGVTERDLLATMQRVVEEKRGCGGGGAPSRFPPLPPSLPPGTHQHKNPPPAGGDIVPQRERFGYWIYQNLSHILLVTRCVQHPECLLFYSAIHPSVLKPFFSTPKGSTRLPPPNDDHLRGQQTADSSEASPLENEFTDEKAAVVSGATSSSTPAAAENQLEEEIIRRVYTALGAIQRDRLPVFTSFAEVVQPILKTLRDASPSSSTVRLDRVSIPWWYFHLRRSSRLQEHFEVKPTLRLQQHKQEEEGESLAVAAGVRDDTAASATTASSVTPLPGSTLVLIDTLSLFATDASTGRLVGLRAASTPSLLSKALQVAQTLTSREKMEKRMMILFTPNSPVEGGKRHDESSLQQQVERAMPQAAEVSSALFAEEKDKEILCIPVDELVDTQHVVAALLDRLSLGEDFASCCSTSSPSAFSSRLSVSRIVLVCGDDALSAMREAVKSAWSSPSPPVVEEAAHKKNLLEAVREVRIYTPKHNRNPVLFFPYPSL